ncbi:MAG: peroxiredoxin family protein [Gemmatimonadaceae bacterium]
MSPLTKWLRVIVNSALPIALTLLLFLAWKNHALRNANETLLKRATRAYSGLVVPAFRTVTLEGDSVTIGKSPSGGRQVLFFFTTTCPFCREILPTWRAVAGPLDTLSARHVEVYGVALDSADARAYAAEHSLNFPIVRLPDWRLIHLYRSKGVPLTVVLSDSGRMLFAQLGQLRSRSTIDSLLAAIHSDVHVGAQEIEAAAWAEVTGIGNRSTGESSAVSSSANLGKRSRL